MSSASLPAATTKGTPLVFTALQIALCSASSLVKPQFPSSAPPPPRLMLDTSSSDELAATTLMPQTMSSVVPVPASERTLIAHTGAPGATPTTPKVLSNAAAEPATCVPCPLPSEKLFLPSLEQSAPPG